MAYILCPDCDKRNPETVDRCKFCGTAIPAEKIEAMKRYYRHTNNGKIIGGAVGIAASIPAVALAGGAAAGLAVIGVGVGSFYLVGRLFGGLLGSGMANDKEEAKNKTKHHAKK